MTLRLRRWLHRLIGGCAAFGLLAGLLSQQHAWVRWSVLLVFVAAGLGIASLAAVRGTRALWLMAHLTLILLGTMTALAVPGLLEMNGTDLRWPALILIGSAVICGVFVAHGPTGPHKSGN